MILKGDNMALHAARVAKKVCRRRRRGGSSLLRLICCRRYDCIQMYRPVELLHRGR
jgi:hypothetical protein